jgi:glycosyltransferase involved in cell wall biosynthesis
VIRPGYLSNQDVSAHLRAADIAVLPYVDGASPRRGSLLACATNGLPIVSTEPVSRAVADAVLAVPAGDASALSAAVLDLAEDSARLSSLKAGSAALTESCSWPRIARQHLEIYRELGCTSKA